MGFRNNLDFLFNSKKIFGSGGNLRNFQNKTIKKKSMLMHPSLKFFLTAFEVPPTKPRVPRNTDEITLYNKSLVYRQRLQDPGGQMTHVIITLKSQCSDPRPSPDPSLSITNLSFSSLPMHVRLGRWPSHVPPYFG